MSDDQSNILLYRTEDGHIKLDVRLEEETVWLTQEDMAQLFGKARSTINEHIRHIFEEGELNEKVVVRNFRITTPLRVMAKGLGQLCYGIIYGIREEPCQVSGGTNDDPVF